MSGLAGGDRETRELSAAGRAWRAVEAWRSPTGWGLAYFVALEEDGEPVADDRLDRRLPLEPDETLDALEDDELEERFADARGLTSTERRITDEEGRPWLAQSRGPVWAEGDVAAGLTSLLFTALGGAAERVEAGGGHAGHMEEEALRASLGRARAAAAGEDSGDADGRARGRPGKASDAPAEDP